MIKFIIYNITDGKIVRGAGVSKYEYIATQCGDGEDFYLNCPFGATHIINNEPVTIISEPIPPTETEIIASLTQAVQGHLDSTARQRNYDGILSLCSYATSLDPAFKAEGQAGVEWRDDCWRMAYTVMAEAKEGARDVPTSDEIVALLPEMVWP